MLKKPLVTLFFFFVFIIMPFVGRAQVDSAAYHVFVRDLSLAPHMPVGTVESGQPFELTMVYTISDGKQTVRYFPENTRSSVISGLVECERVLKRTKWQEIYPELKTGNNFSIVIPMVFRFANAAGITREEEEAVIRRLFEFTGKVDPPYKILDIVFVGFFKR
ncbi:hypothetical protein [Chitinophaga varians]|uniref:hypothetical protein n=1 Tax=Chitinophaga varians TaxID=2202339 RepID=UPI00165F8E40|nr:hypothetical protein [Chitinophaga varians]MBC9909306.1 hypothetical protein [Chitinophaga varians]